MSADASLTLGEFIRAHRERLTPEEVGLKPGPRRRAKGLRREELAAMCNISATWLTWIEQGRDRAVSAATLAAIASALRLNKTERAYAFSLARLTDSELATQLHRSLGTTALAKLLSHINVPAYVLNEDWDAIAWNDPAASLFVGWLDEDASERNLLRFLFIDPRARTLINDWDVRTKRVVAEFRVDQSTRLDTFEIRSLVNDLCQQSPVFDKLWSSLDVLEREGGQRTFNHPTDGLVTYQQMTFRLASSTDLKLVTLF